MKQLEKKYRPVLFFSILYILAFTAYYVSVQSFEFVLYVGVLVFFFTLIFSTLHRSKFSPGMLWALSIWGLLHMAGGSVKVGGGVLYTWVIYPFYENGPDAILKFDQVLHFYGFAVTTFVAYHLLKPYLNEKTNYKVIYALLVLIGTGAGVINEIVEFTATLFAETGVGGYLNTSLDLIANTLGAITAVTIIHFQRKKKGN